MDNTSFLDYKQMGDLFAVIDSRINKNNTLNQVPGTYVAKITAVSTDGLTADCQVIGDPTIMTGLKNKTGVILNVGDEVYLFAPKNDLTNVYIDKSKNGNTNVNTILWNQIDNMDAIALRTDLVWANIADAPTDLLNQSQLADALTNYVTDGTMTTALADTLNTGNFNTIITKEYIASLNLIVGDQILMGANAKISWLNVTSQPTIPTTASQVGARPDTWTPTATDVGARPSSWLPTASQVGARANDWLPTASQISALATNWVGTTYIDANGVYTGTVVANKVIAGTMTGMILNGTTVNAIDWVNIGTSATTSAGIKCTASGGYGGVAANDARGMNITSSTDISLIAGSSNYVTMNSGLYMFNQILFHATAVTPQIFGTGSVLQISYANDTNTGVIFQAGAFRLATSGNMTLGQSTKLWGQIYSNVSTISTSDRTQKNTIVPLDTKAIDFIMALNPVSYKFNDGESNRTHFGMISQDIEDEMTSLNMTSLDFAGFIKSPNTKDVVTIDAKGKEIITTEEIPNEFVYGLRYEEFISPIIKTIQLIKKEKDAEILALTKRIEILESK